MRKTIDLSELTEEQKASLVTMYMKDLARAYEMRAERFRANPDDLLPGIASSLLENGQEVYRLEQWVSIIIAQHIGRHMASQMNQVQMANAEKPKVEMDGIDVGKLYEYIAGAKAQTKKILTMMKSRGKADGEKRCLEMLFAFETIDNVLLRIGSAR